MGTIYKKSTGFAQISNDFLNDEGLTFKAKGLFSYLYSKPEGWNFEAERISENSKDGIKAVYSALKELEKNGYLKREKKKGGKTIYLLTFVKNDFGHKPIKATLQNDRLTNNQTDKTGGLSNKDINSNTDIISNTDKEHSSLENPINKIFDILYQFNPMINYGNIFQRRAIEDLLKKHTIEELESITNYAIKIQGKPFSPTITTPIQLKNKLGELKSFYLKEKNSSTNISMV